MQVLMRFFIALCVLRRAPQELPASSLLLGVTLGANLLVGLLVALAAGLPLVLGLTQKLAELALFLVVLRQALTIRRHPARFLQAATALTGAGVVLGFLALPPLMLDPGRNANPDLAAIGALLLLALVVWGLLVSGHILRHTFEITLGQGVAVATLFELLSVIVIGLFVG